MADNINKELGPLSTPGFRPDPIKPEMKLASELSQMDTGQAIDALTSKIATESDLQNMLALPPLTASFTSTGPDNTVAPGQNEAPPTGPDNTAAPHSFYNELLEEAKNQHEPVEGKNKGLAKVEEEIKTGKASSETIRQFNERRKMKSKEQNEAKQKNDKEAEEILVIKELGDKMVNGSITDEEADKLIELTEEKEKREGKTKEKGAEGENNTESLKKEFDTIADGLASKKSSDIIGDLIKLQQLQDKIDGKAPQMSEPNAKKLIQSILNFGGNENPRQKEIRTKLEQLMGMEVQVLMVPQRLEALKIQADDIKSKIKEIDNKTKIPDFLPDEEKYKQRMSYYGLCMRLNNINAETERTKNAMPILVGEFKDTMQYVRRKLGITYGFGALLEWAEAKVIKTATNIYANQSAYRKL